MPTYVERASPLHAARAGVAAAYCGALAFSAALYPHPLVLTAVIVASLGAGLASGTGREVVRSLLLALPLALLVTLVNPLVYQGGDTLLVRGGELLGRRFDVTLEALVAGAFAGLRVTALVVALGLLSAAVDPDDLLRLFRRVGYRSALTSSLAVRLVPVLARDAAGMSDAARCRPRRPGRLAVARATLAGALDRAVDVAAALEVRGYARAGRPARRERVRPSRHDVTVALAAAGISLSALAGRVAGAGGVETYPRLDVPLGTPELALAASVLLLAALPFALPSARLGVARA